MEIGLNCLSRIDQFYNPTHIQDAHWTTEILDTVAGSSDHCAVLNTLELRSANQSMQSRGKDLFTIKEDIIFQPSRINSELATINAKHVALFEAGADPNDTNKSLLKEVSQMPELFFRDGKLHCFVFLVCVLRRLV